VKPRVGHDKNGNKLEKRIILKVIIGDIQKTHIMTAPAGKGYSTEDVLDIRASAIDRLDTKYPMFEFNEVEVGKNQFNYIMCGTRKILHQPELINGTPESDAENLAKLYNGLGGDRNAPADSRSGSGSDANHSVSAESPESIASRAESNSRGSADGSGEQENLPDQGPHDSASESANDADDQGRRTNSI